MFSNAVRNNFETVSVHDLHGLLGKINLVDIREVYEYKEGHVPTAKNIPMDNILAKPDKYLEKSKQYHIICQTGGRSLMACSVLASQGFKVINVFGGTGSYIRPLER